MFFGEKFSLRSYSLTAPPLPPLPHEGHDPRAGEASRFLVSPLVAVSMPICFALWDGSRRDRNGQKAVTTWYKLRIQ